VTPIPATVQRAAPKPDRDVTPQPDDNPSALPKADPKQGFGDILRTASRGAAPASVAPDPGESGAKDGPGGPEDEPAAGPAPALSASQAAAILATLLGASSAPPTSALDEAASGSGGPHPGAATTGSGATGNGPGLRTPSVPATPGDAVGRDDVAEVDVLDRAVHFKPVLPREVPAASALPADPGSPATAARPAGPAPADSSALRDLSLPASADAEAGGNPILRTGPADPGPQTIPKVPLPVRSGPEPRAAEGALPDGATGPDRSYGAAPEDSRALTGIAALGSARTGSALTGRHGAEGGSPAGSPDAAGAGPGAPAVSLPTLAAVIRDELERTTASGPAARAQADPPVRDAPDGPLRVLRIQLRPEELGIVTVELRLADGQLETHLRAARPETAALLHRDAAILTDLLKQANYQAAVTVGPARPAEAGGFSGGNPSQGQAAFTDGGARPGPGQDRQRQADQRPASGRRDGERMDESVRPRDGGVYL
jgi:chemotaxis protein MotD